MNTWRGMNLGRTGQPQPCRTGAGELAWLRFPACPNEAPRPPLLIEIGGAVKICCYGEFFRCSGCKMDSDQRFEFASIFAYGGAAETARLAKLAVFAAVTSKLGRRFGRFV